MNDITEFTFELNANYSKPLYQQLYEYIKCEIENGNIAPGCKLPSTRKLSEHLSISRNTAETAYNHLLGEGYLQSRSRSGIYVSREIDHDIMTHFRAIKRMPINTEEAIEEEATPYDFRNGCVDLDSFPYAVWKRLTNHCISPTHAELLTYGNPQGELSLRSEIRKYIHHARGVNCSTDQIIITSGTQHSLDLVCKLIRDDYSAVAVEEPGYLAGRIIIKSNGFRSIPIRLDTMGICIDQLYKSGSKVALVTPSHQFPVGMIMPVAKKLALLKWAEDVNGIIIENDYQGEFSYKKKSIPCLQHLDQNGHVVYSYTFSSSLLPAVKIGVLVLPPKLLEKYRHELYLLEQPVSMVQQRVLELFIAGGYWEKHIKKMKKNYARKHLHMISAVTDILCSDAEIIGNSAGLHILLRIKNGMSEKQLIDSAQSIGVKVYPTSIYWSNPAASEDVMILLGYGGIDENCITEGIKRLKQAWL